jgi:hypothetical protein
VKDTTLPLGGGPDQRSPIAIRAGQSVVFSTYTMHRRTDLWGDDALEFKPSRWEQKVPAWQYLPFLGGPRICIGQQFALTEAGFLLVRLLKAFDAVEAVDMSEMRKMNKGLGLTMCKWIGNYVDHRCCTDNASSRARRWSERSLAQGGSVISCVARWR